MPRLALVVANGTLPREEIVRREIADADFILAADGGADKLALLGIVPNAVLGDFDSLTVDLPETVQEIPAPDQNRTDLDKAVGYLKDEGYDAITLIGVTGDRLDHSFGALAVVCKFGVRLVDDVGVAVSVVGPGQIALDTRPGQTVSLLPCGRVTGLTTRNLKWDLANADFSFGVDDGTSNVATADHVELFVKTGMLIVYLHHE